MTREQKLDVRMIESGFKFDNQWTGGVITVCGFAMFIIVVRREL